MTVSPSRRLRSPVRLALALALVLGLSGILACQPNPDGAPRSADPVPTWEVDLITQIGAPDDPGAPLTWVPQALLSADGQIFLSQPMDLQVRSYDPAEPTPRTMGRQGDGPGEFSSMERIGWHGDSLFVSDWQARIVSFFSADGVFLSRRRWVLRVDPQEEVAGATVFTGVPSLLLGDGSALVRPITLSPFMPPGEAERSVQTIPILRMDAEGAVMGVVATEERDRIQAPVMEGGRPFPLTAPFPDEPLLAFDPFGGGVVVVQRRVGVGGEPRAFRILMVNAEGDTVLRREFGYDPHPVSDLAVEEAIRRQREVLIRRQGAAPDVSTMERGLRAHGLLPAWSIPVTHLAVGTDGSIWLRREDTAADHLLWIVLDRELRVEGSVRLPRQEVVSDARSGDLLTIGEGPLDEPYVTLYRIRR